MHYNHGLPSGFAADCSSDETQGLSGLWPGNAHTDFASRPTAQNAVYSTGSQHEPLLQFPSLIGGIAGDPHNATPGDNQDVPPAPHVEPPRLQDWPLNEEVGQLSFPENAAPWSAVFVRPEQFQAVIDIVSGDAGELPLDNFPGPGPQSSITSGFIEDIACPNAPSSIGALVHPPGNATTTCATILRNSSLPENAPQLSAEILLGEGVGPREEPQACGTIDKRSRPHRPPMHGPQEMKQARVAKSVSRKQPKVRILNKPAVKKVFQDDTGNVQGTMQVLGAKQRSRSALTKEGRASAAETRRIHACIRCRMLKKKCVMGEQPNGPCECCLLARPYILKMPCLRATVTEAALFRLRPPADDPERNWTRRTGVFTLEDDKALLARPRQIQLTQNFGPVLTVSVDMFTPEPGDKTAYQWQDEYGSHTMEIHPFKIVRYDEAKVNMMQYIEALRESHLEYLLDPSEKILWESFAMAIDMGHLGNSRMLKKALSLWSAGRIIEDFWRICGEDQLGIDLVSDITNPWHDTIPIPPIMDTQLDQLVIRGFLIPLRTGLLQELEAKIMKKSKDDWLEIFLTMFILLNNTEKMLAHTRRFANRYGMSGRFGPLGHYSLAESYFFASNIMLTYYHSVYQGSSLMSFDRSSPDAMRLAGLTDEQVRFLERLKFLIREKGEAFADLRSKNKYETNLYWCHQLLFDGWTTHSLAISEIEE